MTKTDISDKAFENPDDTIEGKTGGDEYLDEAGSDDDKKAAKYIKQYEKEREELRKKRAAEIKEKAVSKKGSYEGYEKELETHANDALSELDWPEGWKAKAFHTKEGGTIYFEGYSIDTSYGLCVIVKRADGELFFRAFTISKDEEIDYTAIRRLVSQAENVIDDAKGLLYLTNPRKKDETINAISEDAKKRQEKRRKIKQYQQV